MTCSQIPGNLFPSPKLKGNHTFTTQAATIGNDEGEADFGVRQGEEEETEPSGDEEVKCQAEWEEQISV